MNRATVTQFAKALGGRLIDSDGAMSTYALPNDEKTLTFRERVPYVTLWGGFNPLDINGSALNVYFSEPQ